MAESKAREQKNKVVGANLGDQDRDTMNAVENSGGDDKQLGSLQAEQELDNDENNNVNRESLQGMFLETKLRRFSRSLYLQITMLRSFLLLFLVV